MKSVAVFEFFAIALQSLFLPSASGFTGEVFNSHHRQSSPKASSVFVAAADKGFGGDLSNDKKNNKKKSLQDEQGDWLVPTKSMSDFFDQHLEWQPLFRSLSASPSVPAMTHLVDSSCDDSNNNDAAFEFHANSVPWKMLTAIPTSTRDKKLIGTFLDSMQQALIDMPSTSDDKPLAEEDLPFIEEGRRMLAVSRFQVISNQNDLFETCWNELTTLSRDNIPNTGSILLLPESTHMNYLQSFCAAKIQKPLEWLGLDECFEITTILRSNTPALRLLHKLSDIPDLAARTDPTVTSLPIMENDGDKD